MKQKKNRFANIVVIVCLTVALIFTASQVYEYHRLDEPMPAGVVTVLMGAWVGELLILAARQVLGADVTRKGEAPEPPGADGIVDDPEI